MRPTTLPHRAYASVRERLLSGELRAGMQLSESELAKQLGMSRTPVREALRQMENEGLLEYARRVTVEAMRVARENAIKAWERQRQQELSEP